jgi:hypothetical protein
MDGYKIAFLLMMCVIGLICAFVGPILTIHSLNTLFGLEIPVTFRTFMAALWLLVVMGMYRAQFKYNNN